jgi:DNA-binding transcriptional MerR regulator
MAFTDEELTMLKIGQLAKHAGLTVRALHHYDAIGMLCPSVRTDAGYRLYHRDDVARLQQIQALRQLGMPLADIGHFLDHSGTSPLAIVERQLAALDRQIDDAARMRSHLQQLKTRLARGEQPDMAAWLTTLEHMTMYDQYFSKEELQQLPLYHDQHCRAEWAELVAEVAQIMQSRALPDSLEAKQLAARWMSMLARDTGGNAEWMARLDSMHVNETAVQEATGISIAMRDYIAEVMGEIKLDAFAKHLQPAEVERMRRHHRSRGGEWMPLLANIEKQMQADPQALRPESIAVANDWHALFYDMIGPDSQTLIRFRAAIAAEPILQLSRSMTDESIAWLRQARRDR